VKGAVSHDVAAVDAGIQTSCQLRLLTMPSAPADLAHPEDPADGLAAVVALRRLADQMEDAQVERALRDGWTWAQVAEALGVTRQAVHKKHARRLRDV
jgi:transcriptional regulator with GAF, ATPase, and Fis domain